MADGDLEGFEVKDEELVDFEGSDYGFGSDEELDVEEDQHENSAEHKFANLQELVKANKDASPTKYMSQKEGRVAEITSRDVVQGVLNLSQPENREESEAGEIENNWPEKQGRVSIQLISSTALSGKGDRKEMAGDAYHKKHFKAELEDGELVELATMPEGSDYEAVRSSDNDKDDAGTIHEKKRRKYRFFSERQFDGPEHHDRKELLSNGYVTGRQFRGRGRPMERAGGFLPHVGGGRGMNVPMPGFGSPNFGQGVMGPERPPLVPLDLFAQVPLPHMGHGFMAPPGGFTPPGRPDFPLSDAIVQEQLLQCQRMAQHIAQLGGPGIGRPQLTRPIGAASLHPFVGLEFMGPGQGMMQLPPQGQDISSNNFGRGQRTNFGEGRGSMPGTAVSLPAPRNGRLGWVPSQMAGNLHPRGRGQNRSHPTSPVWPSVGDNVVVGGPMSMDASQPNYGHASAPGGQMLNMGDTYGPATLNAHTRPSPQFHGGVRPTPAPRVNGSHGVGERFQRNGYVHNPRPEASSAPAKPADLKGMNMANAKNEKQQRVSSAAVSGTTSRGNGAAINSSASSNLIHLSAPVLKSRVLTVCGLPENTPMSMVVETFEKQGKMMDFRKNEKGDVFTITFSNVMEAVSAKRHLHRSLLAGRQITVEYSTDKM
ncbi:hypothetical protein O6H91_03G110100 [Diphasiastrum complanatum]|nr:hypothetical protein O6H91_03G110100 [Diphasiastrum complanatum]KAJ7563440.1 hypothetical protein O6H91_03G110100 [Diphasiastrum complanatum]